jgi:hypothetical protein
VRRLPTTNYRPRSLGSFIPSRRGGSKPRKDRRRDASDNGAGGAASNLEAASADGVDIFVSKLQGFMHTLLSPKATDAVPSALMQPSVASDAELVSAIPSPPIRNSWRVRQYANGEEMWVSLCPRNCQHQLQQS